MHSFLGGREDKIFWTVKDPLTNVAMTLLRGDVPCFYLNRDMSFRSQRLVASLISPYAPPESNFQKKIASMGLHEI